MSIKITFELSDADLDYFRGAFRKAKEKAKERDEATILHLARRAAREMSDRKLPDFVTERIQALDCLTRMLEDKEWNLGGSHRKRVLQALAYFAEPADLVPDQIPVLGFLDDAIMVELVVQELRPEIDAYDAFCKYRDAQRADKVEPDVMRKRLDARRRAMYARMEDRREKLQRRGGFFSIFR
ncbi:MAG TPA: YkvA family protein [Myxococcota bacterium]|nr:YkvA family protein [Myxococcota bacterium]